VEFKDYYATLGVTKSATQKEIKQTFRKLARKHHPDVNPGDKVAEAKFKEINEAYEVLGDAAKRKKYDELGANWRAYEQAERAGGPNPFAGQWNANTSGGSAGAGGGFRTMTQEEMEEMFGDQNPFSDFFTTFFGGGGFGQQEPSGRGGARGRGRQRPGRDVEHEIELSLEDAYHGTTRRLSLKHDGHARTVDVRIPAGVGDGSRVRISGEGESGTGGAASGDLYLRVRLAPHPLFERKGRDVYVKVPLPVTTAVVGGESRSADDLRQVGAAEDPGADTERPGLPPEGIWHAGGRQERREGRRVRACRDPAARAADARRAPALRSAREIARRGREDTQRRLAAGKRCVAAGSWQ